MNSSIEILTESFDAFKGIKNVPSPLYFIGNIELLKRPKISIVGSRKPLNYTKNYTYLFAQKLSSAGICIVSGGAMGVDAIAHTGAGAHNTIMVSGTGLDMRYPTVNQNVIKEIEMKGLVLSQFKMGEPSLKWNFPLRNELIVALGEVLIVTQADVNSGTMHSVSYAQKMGKKIYVLPHRLGESEGTNSLLAQGLAEALFDVDDLIAEYGEKTLTCKDDFLNYCESFPLYQEAIAKYGQMVFEYECLGKIMIENGRIKRIIR